MLTYDDTPEIRELSAKYGLQYKTIPMKTTHHLKKQEIIISDNFDWWTQATH
jgi:DNA adenine methylase